MYFFNIGKYSKLCVKLDFLVFIPIFFNGRAYMPKDEEERKGGRYKKKEMFFFFIFVFQFFFEVVKEMSVYWLVFFGCMSSFLDNSMKF